MAKKKTREITLPDGSKAQGFEKAFDIVKESWNEYKLSDGTKLRVKVSLVKAFQVTDEKGNPKLNADGDPEIYVSTIIAVSSTASDGD